MLLAKYRIMMSEIFLFAKSAMIVLMLQVLIGGQACLSGKMRDS